MPRTYLRAFLSSDRTLRQQAFVKRVRRVQRSLNTTGPISFRTTYPPQLKIVSLKTPHSPVRNCATCLEDNQKVLVIGWHGSCAPKRKGYLGIEGSVMKILLPVDGSPSSDSAVEQFSKQPWPSDSEVKVINAVEIPIKLGGGETWIPSPGYHAEVRQIFSQSCCSDHR